ncbi:hypothetical protein LRP49_20360 [Enterovibrio sp. ZSDZ35]|uniref:Uncharacterized protein n=1 Tax=Enterovibrio qingdaonensis TaxID=2899818 RepID=A0ABT5QRC2_9GAMM|nr:hypothetical protein [Enterovibrio sp. ZSDZ35]MDD1783531.1 hypothetical protein [Enterovibrio sp. ZSDZ35]
MAKTLCEWKTKEIENGLDDLLKLVKKSEYVCRKCARVANTKKVLCKPIPLKD